MSTNTFSTIDISNNDHKQCRICMCTEDVNDLIAPCYCAGSMKYVHRSCIDEFRATNPHGRAFTHCPQCQFEYKVVVQDEEVETNKRLWRFRKFVARDTLLVFICIQAIIIGLGLLVRWHDLHAVYKVRDLFPDVISSHDKTSYYIWGALLFFALLGIFGVFYWCFHTKGCTDERELTQPNDVDPYVCCIPDPCSGPCYCYCPDTHVHHGSGGSGNSGYDCMALIFGMVIILFVVLVLIGIVTALFLGTLAFQRIMQKHMKKLWLREETKKFVLVDFQYAAIPPPPTVPPPYTELAPSAPPIPPMQTYPTGLY
jgi:uncharacterized membrane protein YidH (DUF202 family)